MATQEPTVAFTFRRSSFTAKGTGNLGIISATLIFVIFLLGVALILSS